MRNRGLGGEIWGVDSSQAHLDTALGRGIIDRAATMEQAAAECDLLVIATPVDTVPALAVKLLNKISGHQTLMDVGSVKGEL
jgi:prephenate dehydrogenase